MNKVLFIDDEQYILKTLERKLSKTEIQGYYANNGEKGLEIMEEENIRVVFTDLMMPYMNGLKVVEEIHRRQPDAVVVVLSGNSQPSAILRTMNTNYVYKYLSKPWKLDEEALDFVRSCLVESEKRLTNVSEEAESLLIDIETAKQLSTHNHWIIVDEKDKVYAASSDNSIFLKRLFESSDYKKINTNYGKLKFYAD